MSLRNPPKALLTDVFGTVVNWRKTVVDYLNLNAAEILNSSVIPTHPESLIRQAASEISWPQFAQEWRDSYYQFTRSYDPATMPFKTIDQHHRESLQVLIEKYGISGFFCPNDLEQIAMIWHYLDPWLDSPPGISKLASKMKVATLSNGGVSLLYDLAQHANLAYTHLLSAETFRAYKPNPVVYLGACASLSLPPNECAMVAAHLGDLKAAHSLGMQTIYIEREQEETWTEDEVKDARNWVDMWIGVEEGGFEEVVRRFELQ